MKSALMAHAAICLASGADWFGKRNKEACGVVYFALERADLVRRRIEAHTVRQGLRDLPIALVSETINLMKLETVAKVVATIRDVGAEYDCRVGLVIFDTFAKLIAAGGGDEDKAKDQGAVFANVQRVKNETDVHVALVGHTGKDVTRGSRGSNAILGDADLMVEISGDAIRTATVTKANDAPEGVLFAFASQAHDFGTDEDGDPITVNVVSDEQIEARPTSSRSKDGWTNGLRFLRDCVAEAVTDFGVEHHIPSGPTVRAVLLPKARAAHNSRYVSYGDGNRDEAERKAWARNFKTARDSNLIGAERRGAQEWIWITK
jgi:hypothetical protein